MDQEQLDITEKLIPVIVTTEFRGVFFGYIEEGKEKEEIIDLWYARCGIYWNVTKGILELAEKGPNKGSRIGSTAPRMQLRKITSVISITPEAEKAWKEV